MLVRIQPEAPSLKTRYDVWLDPSSRGSVVHLQTDPGAEVTRHHWKSIQMAKDAGCKPVAYVLNL